MHDSDAADFEQQVSVQPSKRVLTPGRFAVFILGAGASADDGLPVMADFMSAARRLLFDSYLYDVAYPREKQAITQMLLFLKACRESSWAVNRDWNNLEELYTQADLRRLANIYDEHLPDQLCTYISWAAWDIYRRSRHNSSFARVLAHVCLSGLIPVVVTTNYDLVCEQSIGCFELEKDRDFEQTRTLVGKYRYPGFPAAENTSNSLQRFSEEAKFDRVLYDMIREKRDIVPIVKLHGSVNWFECGETCYAYGSHDQPGRIGLHAPPIESNLFDQDRIEELLQKETGSSAKELGEVRPAIIPPSLGKTSLKPYIRLQWNAAVEAIASAQQIWIVGYSFPASDLFITRLVSEGLRNNDDLKFVGIVNPEDRLSWETRVANQLSPTLLQRQLYYFKAKTKDFYSAVLDEVKTWNQIEQSTVSRFKQ